MSTTTLYTVAHAIKKARQRVDMKQETAAKLLHITRPTLSGYENACIGYLPLSLLFQMSELYRCSIASFFDSPLSVIS